MREELFKAGLGHRDDAVKPGVEAEYECPLIVIGPRDSTVWQHTAQDV